MTAVLGAWGLLPVVVPAFAFVAARLGSVVAGKGARLSEQAACGVLMGFALVLASVRALGQVHGVHPWVLLVPLGVVTLGVALATRRPPVGLPRVRWDALAGPLVLVAIGAMALEVLAARWLPVWQWDALGYHLPFVHFVLQGHGTDAVPPDLDYIATYPHNAELFMVALRACLPDDRLVDLAQIPFGVGCAIAIGSLARRFGADRASAVAAGAAWLAVPIVFLQMPTDYVDVATAMFLLLAIEFALGEPDARHTVLAGVAIGLFLGTKPSAPLPAMVLLAVVVVRAARAKQRPAALVAVCAVLLFGAETYVQNVLAHGNPVWPVRISLGPLHLPGPHSMADMLASGANAPHLTGPLPIRFVRSLLALHPVPAFDMRIGGTGVLLVVALPFAVAELVQRKSVATWVAAASTLLCPDPAISRYVLGFIALTFALAAPRLARLAAAHRPRAGVVLAAIAQLEVLYAIPGLTGEGPPLRDYASMTDETRALAVGADGPPIAMDAARRRVGPDEAFAFDQNLDLCDLAWDASQSYRVVFFPGGLESEADVVAALARDRVRIFAVGEGGPVAALAGRDPGRFERLGPLENCRTGRCAVYLRRD